MRFGELEVSVCVAESPFLRKQVRQGEMNPKQLIVPAERGCDSQGYLEMVDSLLRFALRIVYLAEDAVSLTDIEMFAILGEEADRVGRSFFCGIELFVPM